MLTSFESITQDITEKERTEILPLVVTLLQNSQGKEKAVKNWQIEAMLRDFEGIYISSVKIRKLIHVIHVEGLVKRLMATSKGYFVTNDIEEYKKYIESREQRERNIHSATKACRQCLDEWQNNNIQQLRMEI
ncbi:hypothetical protein KA005_41395 [bacterium]|nr:hypothetical protein [bacterium]